MSELERIVRLLGAPPKEALAAARETLTAASERAPLTEQALSTFIEQGTAVCATSYRVWEQCTDKARVHLRGFSLELLSMVSQQLLNLDRAFRDYKQSELDMSEASERAVMLRERNRVLFEQGRAVLQMVGGAAVVAECTGAADGSVTLALNTLAETGKRLLADENPVVRSRCQLYHLDSGYVQALLAASTELGRTEQIASDESSVARKRAEVERLIDLIYPLLSHMSQVFELARRFEPSIAEVPKLDANILAPPAKRPSAPNRGGRPPPSGVQSALRDPEPRRVQRLTIPNDDLRSKR